MDKTNNKAMETNLEKAKRLFFDGIEKYPEMTMDRQGFIISLLKIAAIPDEINDLDGAMPCFNAIKDESKRASLQTREMQNPQTTDREIMLGERAFINGAMWVMDQLINKA